MLGRKDRRLKLHGKKVASEEVERCFAATGPVAVVPVAGDAAVVFVEGDAEPYRAAWTDVLHRLGLPAECLRLRAVPAMPCTAAGKVDLVALAALTDGG